MDAIIRVDVQLVGLGEVRLIWSRVNAVARADDDTGPVLDSHTGVGDYVSHDDSPYMGAYRKLPGC